MIVVLLRIAQFLVVRNLTWLNVKCFLKCSIYFSSSFFTKKKIQGTSFSLFLIYFFSERFSFWSHHYLSRIGAHQTQKPPNPRNFTKSAEDIFSPTHK